MKESGENYLETILILSQKKDAVRSIDVANELSFSKPSVSRAVKILVKKNMIDVAPSGEISLTRGGFEKATAIYERHRVLSGFFTKVLGVDDDVASADACRIEHVISQESFDKLKDFMGSVS
ncbi:MAG: metal-dependent transcriptional regulator [Synergistaceae bacterium]